MQTQPTTDFYDLFQSLYNYFNKKLFQNELPQCIIVVTRKKNCFGYYISKKWVNNQNVFTDEIAINPTYFSRYPIDEILKTLVHEMCHLWQQHFGKASIRTYHNSEWGNKMETIGLMPSNTGKEGGSKTGQQMMEYVIDGGLFYRATTLLKIDILYKEKINKLWFDTNHAEKINTTTNEEEKEEEEQEPKDKKKKIKYTCNNCNVNVWGKNKIELICGLCSSPFLPS